MGNCQSDEAEKTNVTTADQQVAGTDQQAAETDQFEAEAMQVEPQADEAGQVTSPKLEAEIVKYEEGEDGSVVADVLIHDVKLTGQEAASLVSAAKANKSLQFSPAQLTNQPWIFGCSGEKAEDPCDPKPEPVKPVKPPKPEPVKQPKPLICPPLRSRKSQGHSANAFILFFLETWRAEGGNYFCKAKECGRRWWCLSDSEKAKYRAKYIANQKGRSKKVINLNAPWPSRSSRKGKK